MTVDVTVESLRRSLGVHLAVYRRAAGVSQPELGQAIGRTRSTVSKIEAGTRGMPETLWRITDDVCGAEGALITEHSTLVQAERDCRAQRRAAQRAQALAARSWFSGAARQPAWDVPWPGMARMDSALAEEFTQVVTRLVRALGRRDAMRVAGWTLAAMGLSGVDPDECIRVAQALEAPHRVDAQVVQNLAVALAQCKRLEDKLGPGEVLDTVVAQHGLVRRLVAGGCPDNLVKPLKLVESDMASSIGVGLINMGNLNAATGYLQRARKAGHDARNPAYAAYAATNASFAAFHRGDTPAALDTAAAARSLAARTDDARLKALAEQAAAGAYALDGQYGPCMAACARSQEFLASANGFAPGSPAYWVHEGNLDSRRSLFLCLLDRPRDAVEAAGDAMARFDRTYVGSYGRCQVRLGQALVLSKEITEAAHVLGHAAGLATHSPRLTAELRTVRTLMQPWENTHAVTMLDARLEACGLTPTTGPTPGSGTRATTTA